MIKIITKKAAKKIKRFKFSDFIIILICVSVILLCILPMLNLLAQSLSSSDSVINGRVKFMPVIHKTIELTEEEIAQQNTEIAANIYNYDYSSDYNYEYDNSNSIYNYEDDFDYDSYYSYENDSDYSYDYYSDTDSENDYASSETYDSSEQHDNIYNWSSNQKPSKNVYKVGVTMESYRYVFFDPSFSRSMWWTAILTIICTIVSLGITVLCAYPLTYDWLKGKTIINTLIIFTMYFSAGTIPNYILMKTLGLLNNPLVLIIPNCLSVFNMIILRSFFYGIPDSLRESAEIDGANPFTVLIKIYLPLSAPVLATLALFYAVGRWNGFSDALLYINSAPQWVPIQLKLWQLIQNMTSIDVTTVEMVSGSVPRASDAIKAAAIMFATVPILVVYPWLQRYFISGVTIGAVKG